MRLSLLTFAVILSLLPPAGYGEDLMDAYQQARANDPVLAQAKATQLAIGEGVAQARAAMLPQINGSVGLNQQSGSSSGDDLSSASGHIRTRSIGVTLNQSIIDLSQWANLSAAHAQASAQDATYQAALQDLFMRVTTAYFGVLTSQDNLTFAKANEAAYKEAYEEADQRFKVGVAAITDVYQAKSYYELARAQTIAAQNTLSDAKEALTQITNQPVGELKTLREDLPMTPPAPADPQAWVQQALQANPTIQANQYSVSAAEHSINAARAGHLPTLSATLSRGKSTSWLENGNYGRIPGNGAYGTTIGLTLNVPIFSGGATQSQVRQSIDQRDEAQDTLEATRRQITRSTLNDYRSVLADISQTQANKASVRSGQEALDATRAGFKVGTETMLNVLNAIQTLTQAESSYSQSRHQLVLDQLALKQSAGSVDVKDIQAINAMLH